MAPARTAILFDLEFTAWEGSRARQWRGPGEHREIIQMAALRIDAATGAVQAEFQRLVRPRLNPVLSDFIRTLTGLTNERLDAKGVDFEAAHEAFLAFRDGDPLFCFGWDEVVIAENVALYGLGHRFGRLETTNLHGFFATAGLPPSRVSSGTLCEALGIAPAVGGRPHDALFDCQSILAAVRHLVAAGRSSPFLTPAPRFGPDAEPSR